jgi:protein SCO1/2
MNLRSHRADTPKGRSTRRSRWLPSLALVTALSIETGCHDKTVAPPAVHQTAASSVPTPGVSVYPLDVALRDEDGVATALDLFRGHPVVVSMFYGSCPAACPLLVTRIKQLEESLPPDVRARTRVLLVSFDADRDTPEALRALARRHAVDPARWRFASASDDHARVLANALGISYRKGEGGMFSHDSVITVLDGEGRIVARTDDMEDAPTSLVAAVTQS